MGRDVSEILLVILHIFVAASLTDVQRYFDIKVLHSTSAFKVAEVVFLIVNATL